MVVGIGKNNNHNYMNNYNGLSFSEKIDVLKERYNLTSNFYREENNNDDIVMEKEYFLTKLAISKIKTIDYFI